MAKSTFEMQSELREVLRRMLQESNSHAQVADALVRAFAMEGITRISISEAYDRNNI